MNNPVLVTHGELRVMNGRHDAIGALKTVPAIF